MAALQAHARRARNEKKTAAEVAATTTESVDEGSSTHVRTPALPVGGKAELMKQVAAIGKWKGATLLADTARFTKTTGFRLTATEDGKRPSPNRVKVTQGTAVCLLSLRHLINVVPDMSTRLQVHVKASGRNALATYSAGEKVVTTDLFGRKTVVSATTHSRITVHDKDTGHSVLHEFGHFLDHYLGDPNDSKGFATATKGSKLADFVDLVRKTESYSLWSKQNRDIPITVNGTSDRSKWPARAFVKIARMHTKHIDYIKQPKEIVARFFDCWAHWQLGKRGFDTALLGTKPDYPVGGYSDADIEKLAPMFEAALGDQLKKSILSALRDLGALAKSRASLGHRPLFDPWS